MSMTAPNWDRATARDGRYDGRFIVGVMSTGIYCLPSCRARPPKPQNVRYFGTEIEAQRAGLRACKRCRPDLHYRGEDADLALFEGLTERVRADVGRVPDVGGLVRTAGVSEAKLSDLIRRHAHLTPASWLKRERIREARALLLNGRQRIVDIGHAVGFESESVFHRQFLTRMRMTPGSYRALARGGHFELRLPRGYRAREVLAFQGRDPRSVCERVDGRRMVTALTVSDGAAVLEIALGETIASCRVHAAQPLGPHSLEALHEAALRMLGLGIDVYAFEMRAARDPRTAPWLASRRGLRVPLTATVFDGLCRAIVGQQVNIAFASTLRSELSLLAGEEAGGLRTPPTPGRLANVDVATLRALKLSGAKSACLIAAAQAVCRGELAIERLADGSAVAAESALVGLRGIGPWTARYTLMRGAGFADCAPIGDVALAEALRRVHALHERPSTKETEALMRTYAPHRSLATCHLWASLGDAA
jgi:AraC family transcriptional regulator, regulatory protein of adaptative response / DNA-3-methyladenine glycosylase II